MIEGGLKYWVSLRQTGIIGPAMAQIRDAIQFHNCIDNVLEYVSDRDSGRAMRNLCAFDADGSLDNSFWGHIYNIGGGESCRVSTGEMYEKMYGKLGFKSLDTVIEPKYYATRNFHGQYYLDSDKLENYLHFRSDSMQYFYDAYLKELGSGLTAGKVITKVSLLHAILFKVLMKTRKDYFSDKIKDYATIRKQEDTASADQGGGACASGSDICAVTNSAV